MARWCIGCVVCLGILTVIACAGGERTRSGTNVEDRKISWQRIHKAIAAEKWHEAERVLSVLEPFPQERAHVWQTRAEISHSRGQMEQETMCYEQALSTLLESDFDPCVVLPPVSGWEGEAQMTMVESARD